MRRYRWIWLAAASLAWWAQNVPAADEASTSPPPPAELSKLRRTVTELSLDVIRAEARAAELKDEEQRLAKLPGQGAEADTRPLTAKPELWEKAVGGSAKGDDTAPPPAVLEKLTIQAKALDDDQKTAIAAWSAAMERSLAFPDKVSEVEGLVGWSWNDPNPRGGVAPAWSGWDSSSCWEACS